MKRFVLLPILLLSVFIFGQNKKYFNDDGTPSNLTKRELFVATFNGYTKDAKFELDDKTLIVITSYEPKNTKTNDSDIQDKTFSYCILELQNQLHGFKHFIKTLMELEFENVIFKTNIVYAFETRRYHFKFTISEIMNFPELVDIEEISGYLKTNNYKNIILAKNPR